MALRTSTNEHDSASTIMTNFIKKHLILPASVGMMSLVGINTQNAKYPLGFGNYFGFEGFSKEDAENDKYRCVNFWAENLREARRRFLGDGQIRVLYYEWNRTDVSDPIHVRSISQVLVQDARIPQEWYITELCFTGTYRPPVEVATDMYAQVPGDHSDKLELWTDPVNYYAKKGAIYDPKSGILRYKIESQPKKLALIGPGPHLKLRNCK